MKCPLFRYKSALFNIKLYRIALKKIDCSTGSFTFCNHDNLISPRTMCCLKKLLVKRIEIKKVQLKVIFHKENREVIFLLKDWNSFV